MVNKVILLGNAGADPIVTQYNGTDCAKFSLATSEAWKDKDGEFRTSTEWHNIVCWGFIATRIGNKLKKGNRVYVEGKITSYSYEVEDVQRKAFQIVADKVRVLTKNASSEESPFIIDSNKSTDSNKNVSKNKVTDIPF